MRGAVKSLAGLRVCARGGRRACGTHEQARRFSVDADVDAAVVQAIRQLALVDDRAPDFVGLWTPTSEEYRREACAIPRGIFDAESSSRRSDPYSLVAADVSSPASQQSWPGASYLTYAHKLCEILRAGPHCQST